MTAFIAGEDPDPFAYLDDPMPQILLRDLRARRAIFRCGTCGTDDHVSVAPDMICEYLSPEATCTNCCIDHDYQYCRDMRGTYCEICGEEAPWDHHDDMGD